jgi:hypothetical protein
VLPAAAPLLWLPEPPDAGLLEPADAVVPDVVELLVDVPPESPVPDWPAAPPVPLLPVLLELQAASKQARETLIVDVRSRLMAPPLLRAAR